jgi:adenine-specific DNA-methyltransferase
VDLTRQRLELQWVHKNVRPSLEPRLLIEEAEYTYGMQNVAGNVPDNRLIFGDNLLALKALEAEFSGKVKCVFIDPPYNTGSAFTQYDDGMEHSLWLSFMRDRVEIVRRLLSEDGSLWITIDDNEGPYLRVVLDELFGRTNWVATIAWQKRTSPDARVALGSAHDNILVFAKDKAALRLNRLPTTAHSGAAFRNPDSDPRGPWASTDFTAQGWRPNQMYSIVSPSGVVFEPPPGRCWANVEERFQELSADGRIWFGKHGTARPRIKNFLLESDGPTAWSWWPNGEVGHNQEAKKESIALFGAHNAFATPKPERLLKRVLELATNPGDLVLDYFAGSGTTGAVAHKMGRRWIMIELGEHCHTHIVPRLAKIIDGADQGGVTNAVGWKGGGSFRYFRLAPSIIEKDCWGREIISRAYNATMLAEALCKLEGFTYAPSDTRYWQQGHSTERDFIYSTTQNLSAEQLAHLSEEVGPGRSLLVFCSAFRGNASRFPNLDVRKIPNGILTRFDHDQDDHSLAVPPSSSPASAEGVRRYAPGDDLFDGAAADAAE